MPYGQSAMKLVLSFLNIISMSEGCSVMETANFHTPGFEVKIQDYANKKSWSIAYMSLKLDSSGALEWQKGVSGRVSGSSMDSQKAS